MSKQTFGKRTKKALKYSLIDMPKSVFGWNQFQKNNKLIGAMFQSITSITCPQCRKGGIRHDHELEMEIRGNETLYPYSCTHCDFAILAPKGKRNLKETIDRIRITIDKERIAKIDNTTAGTIARSHQKYSRIFHALSIACIMTMLYCVATNKSNLIAANWFFIGFMFWFQGIAKSYRYWQVTTNTFFIKGSFLRWFKDGKWYI